MAEFISRLEKTFHKANGHENITTKTRNTLLYGQLHEGLRYNLLKTPAVSGASNDMQLSVAGNEEGRQTELARRQHYQQDSSQISRREVTKYLKASVRLKGVSNTPIVMQNRSQGWQPRC